MRVKKLNIVIGFAIVLTVVISMVFVFGQVLAQKSSGPKVEEKGMGRIAIVGYKPKAGKVDALNALMKTHVPPLRAAGLATARESIVMKAKDGTVIEVFEWESKEANESAHTNPVVQAMWKEYSDVCDYVPLGSLDETKQMFADFEALKGGGRDQ